MIPSWTPPSTFEEYRLLRPLGNGAMGQVWLAHDGLLDRRVAIKFIASAATNADVRERFLTEARAIARLSHPNVVVVHRVGSLNDQPFMVSEWVEGVSLDRLARPIAAPALRRIALELSRGLAAAHRAGVLHRDVKPANAMVTVEGAAKLLDFGLAKLSLDTVVAVSVGLSSVDALDPHATLDAPLRAVPGPTREVRSNAVTRQGAIVGTPLYLAPECWRGAPASRRSDVYALGALLYELCAGQPPVRFLGEGNINELANARDARPLSEVAPDIDARLAAIIERCLSRNEHARFEGGDELREALERAFVERDARPRTGNPYRGLSTFEAEHRALFFGRDAEVRAACDRLRASSLLVVAGESGVGKSSLCRAGVLPALEAGALGDGRTWKSVACLPGRYPLRALAAACASAAKLDAEQLQAQLTLEPRSLGRTLVQAMPPHGGLVLFVDQLEEWVTFGAQHEAGVAAQALASVADSLPSLRVVATVRTDLLASLTVLPGISSELPSALFLLGPVPAENLAQVIEGPAEVFGARFETRAMVERLVDFAAHGGALPLLQFALARLWDARGEGLVLTEASLAALGGVSGALASHADRVIDAMPATQQLAARRLLTSLVTSADRRRRRTEGELLHTPLDRDTLTMLARARLLVARDSQDGTTWELAHEALLREWPTLARWRADDAGGLLWRERLSSATGEWLRLARANEALWGRVQLAEFERHVETLDLSAPAAHHAFLDGSRAALRRRRLRLPLAVLVLVVAAGATWLGARQAQHRALEARVLVHLDAADGHGVAADALGQQFEQQRDAAFSAFDRGDWAKGNAGWFEALASKARWARELELLQVELDAAQFVLPEAPAVVARLPGVISRGLAFDAATGRSRSYEAELLRLDALGAGAASRAAIDAPATLSVSPARRPSDTLERWDGTAWRTASFSSQLEPGSWRLTRGHARLPFIAARGEAVALTFDDVTPPRGFTFIAPGWSLVGASGDEAVRREFYDSAPLHRVFVEGFFIGTREVTFADWLAWLETVSPDERARRTPHLEANVGAADTARLQLMRDSAGWRIDFTLDGVSHRAGPGEAIHYGARTSRVDQPWEQLPVVGVSPLDAVAYVEWLSNSGRVPGARLCTEYEWERAARGADGRLAPQGELRDVDDVNIDATYGRLDGAYGPDAVGTHPASRSPFDVDDLQGNVWEIVRPTDRDPKKEWATKGGSWQTSNLSSHFPNSYIVNASYRQAETGVRVCASRH